LGKEMSESPDSKRFEITKRLLLSSERLPDEEFQLVKDWTVADFQRELEKRPRQEQEDFNREYGRARDQMMKTLAKTYFPGLGDVFRQMQLSTALTVAPLRQSFPEVGPFSIKGFIEDELNKDESDSKTWLTPGSLVLCAFLYRGERRIVERAITRLLKLVETNKAVLVRKGEHTGEFEEEAREGKGVLVLSEDRAGLTYVDILSLGDVLSDPKKDIRSNVLMREVVRQLLLKSRAVTEGVIADENKEHYPTPTPSKKWRGRETLAAEASLDQIKQRGVEVLAGEDLEVAVVEQVFIENFEKVIQDTIDGINKSGWNSTRKRTAISLLRYYESNPTAISNKEAAAGTGLSKDTIIERKKDLREMAFRAILDENPGEEDGRSSKLSSLSRVLGRDEIIHYSGSPVDPEPKGKNAAGRAMTRNQYEGDDE